MARTRQAVKRARLSDGDNVAGDGAAAAAHPADGRPVYETEDVGAADTVDYKCYIKADGIRVSPWHDVPHFAEEAAKVFNYVVVAPKGSSAAMAIGTALPLHPIMRVAKEGAPAHHKNVFPYHGQLATTGFIPQTCTEEGPDSPVTAILIGDAAVRTRGEVVQVRVLGAYKPDDVGGGRVWLVIEHSSALATATLKDVDRSTGGAISSALKWYEHMRTGVPSADLRLEACETPETSYRALRIARLQWAVVRELARRGVVAGFVPDGTAAAADAAANSPDVWLYKDACGAAVVGDKILGPFLCSAAIAADDADALTFALVFTFGDDIVALRRVRTSVFSKRVDVVFRNLAPTMTLVNDGLNVRGETYLFSRPDKVAPFLAADGSLVLTIDGLPPGVTAADCKTFFAIYKPLLIDFDAGRGAAVLAFSTHDSLKECAASIHGVLIGGSPLRCSSHNLM